MSHFKTLLGSSPKLYLRLTSVSRSRIFRSFDCFVIIEGKLVNVNDEVSAYASKKLNPLGSVLIKGSGMDMAYTLVAEVSRMVFEGDASAIKYEVL
jgi:hypothetical protein